MSPVPPAFYRLVQHPSSRVTVWSKPPLLLIIADCSFLVLRCRHGAHQFGQFIHIARLLHVLIILQFLATALLALGGVEARKNKVRVSQWVSTDCSGQLSAKQFEIKLGECETVNAQSLKFHKPKKDKDLGWVGLAEDGRHNCQITTYSGPGCLHDNELRHYTVPSRFEECNNPSAGGVRSIKFTCGNAAPSDDLDDPITSTTTATYYSFAPDGRASAVRSTSTMTILKRGEPTAAAEVLEPRDVAGSRYGMKNVWMKHPWGGSPLCYECWYRHKKNTDKFECESGRDQTNSPCGARPDKSTLISTVTLPDTTVTSLISKLSFSGLCCRCHGKMLTSLLAGVAAETATTAAPSREVFDERSESKIVRIVHPFRNVETCAKAKWKHAGKDKQRVTLKGPASCKDVPQYPVKLVPSLSTTTVDGATRTLTRITMLPGTVSSYVPPTPSPSYVTVSTLVAVVAVVDSSTTTITMPTTTIPMPTSTTTITLPSSTSTVTLTTVAVVTASSTSSDAPTLSRAAAIADLWNQ